MRIALKLLMIVVLAASLEDWNTAVAADYSWTGETSLVGGVNRNCGDATIFPRWQIEITGQTLKAVPTGGGIPASLPLKPWILVR
jgi:hypothetical protein